MRRLSEQEVLAVWEHGQGRSAQQQALAPLSVAFPERGAEELARLPLGERDRLLLCLRRETLGGQLQGSSGCPRCACPIDFAVEVEDVLAAGRAGEAAPLAVETGGWRVRLRLLDSRDLAFAAAAGDLGEARRRLVERAVVAAAHDGEEAPSGELPEEVIAAVAERLEEADPLAVVPLAMRCGRCGCDWQPLLDVGAFVWREIAARAERVMNDVHALAHAYGWSEETILTLSAARRQFYLDLAPPSPARGVVAEEEARRA